MFSIISKAYFLHILLNLQLERRSNNIWSDDKAIKFWTQNENCENNNKQLWSCSQTIRKYSSYIYALSMNEDQIELI
ncbi:unnamed protein product [Paramecium pentaurelia]|uniref:Uncharacterized protein n=1 Tax=Paramecium pentaurelia TaxID=43138 RepID=A0A8S1X142_9CILI|nr:unnamed protein product [Paramecium pentaurelia]